MRRNGKENGSYYNGFYGLGMGSSLGPEELPTNIILRSV